VAILHAAGQQIAAHVQCVRRWKFSHEAPNKTDPQRYFVIAQCVGTHSLPAASLINVTITADQKVVGNVVPSSRLYVEALKIIFIIIYFK